MKKPKAKKIITSDQQAAGLYAARKRKRTAPKPEPTEATRTGRPPSRKPKKIRTERGRR